jgi:hypothetical protein
MKFPIDPRQLSEIQRYSREIQKHGSMVPKDAGRMFPLIQEAMKNRPSPQQLAAMREQARWASEAARAIDPATLKALQDLASSATIADKTRWLQKTLGSDGLAAANLLTNRLVGVQLPALSREEAQSREERVREISPEDLRSAEELATSPIVRELLEELVEEAEATLAEEGASLDFYFGLDAEEPGEIELYGVHFEPSNIIVNAMIIYVALQGAAEVAPEQVAALQQTLDALADLLAVLLAVLLAKSEFDNSQTPRRNDQESDLPAVRLIDELLAEDPDYDEETWPEIAEAIDQDRPSDRKLFAT